MISHFGLRQVYQILTYPNYQVNWIYKLVRNPLMYSFIITCCVATTMATGRLFFVTISTVYMVIAVKLLKEKGLRKVLGDKY